MGAGYGTAKSSMGIFCNAIRRPELVMKSLIPVVMSGIIAVYGLVVSVLIAQNVRDDYTLEKYAISIVITIFLGHYHTLVQVLAVS